LTHIGFMSLQGACRYSDWPVINTQVSKYTVVPANSSFWQLAPGVSATRPQQPFSSLPSGRRAFAFR
jgi:hypothetical protein